MIPPPGTGGSNPARNKVVFPRSLNPARSSPSPQKAVALNPCPALAFCVSFTRSTGFLVGGPSDWVCVRSVWCNVVVLL